MTGLFTASEQAIAVLFILEVVLKILPENNYSTKFGNRLASFEFIKAIELIRLNLQE